jgi:hypothetical protein
MVTNPAENGAKDILAKYDIPIAWVENKMNMYNKAREFDKKEDEHGKKC